MSPALYDILRIQATPSLLTGNGPPGKYSILRPVTEYSFQLDLTRVKRSVVYRVYCLKNT